MTISRREMLKLAAAASAACISATTFAGTACAAAGRIPIGLGLWSVRHECEKDLPAVLEAVSKMGYQGVELAHSDYGFDGPAWRELLDKNGLKCCGMHTSLPKLQGDHFQKLVDFQKALGSTRLILAGVPKKNLESPAGMLETAKLFNQLADRLAPHGLKIGYHCHAGDFKPAEGQVPWLVLGKNSRKDVILQLDVGNCLQGGGDYLAMLREFPGRGETVHLKEYSETPGAVIGEGKIQWDEVFRICETVAGTQWYIVEEESRKGPESIEAVRRSLAALRKMGK